MSKKFLLLAFIFSASIAFSQNGFVEGYVVAPDKDTIKGFIKKDAYFRLAQAIQYKTHINGEEVTSYTVQDIHSFGFVKGNKFRKITFVDALDSNKTKQQFAWLLVEGKYLLFAIGNNSNYNFFIGTTADSGYYIYDDVFTSAGYERRGNYKQILHFISHQCNQSGLDAERVRFTEQALISFLVKLNKCAGKTTPIVHYTRPKSKLSLMVHAGAMLGYKNHSQYNYQTLLRIHRPVWTVESRLILALPT